MISFYQSLCDVNEKVSRYIYSDKRSTVESVTTYTTKNVTMYISVQTCCKVGCGYCFHGTEFHRSLTCNELLFQVMDMLVRERIDSEQQKNLVVMFMNGGDPSHNWEDVKLASTLLMERYPRMRSVINTTGIRNRFFFDDVIQYGKNHNRVDLQYPIRHWDDSKLDEIIPQWNRMTLEEIANHGKLWAFETHKKAICDYIPTVDNIIGHERLFQMFPQDSFKFKLSGTGNVFNCYKAHSKQLEPETMETLKRQFESEGYETEINQITLR